MMSNEPVADSAQPTIINALERQEKALAQLLEATNHLESKLGHILLPEQESESKQVVTPVDDSNTSLVRSRVEVATYRIGSLARCLRDLVDRIE
jgi:hypothetical protein